MLKLCVPRCLVGFLQSLPPAQLILQWLPLTAHAVTCGATLTPLGVGLVRPRGPMQALERDPRHVPTLCNYGTLLQDSLRDVKVRNIALALNL